MSAPWESVDAPRRPMKRRDHSAVKTWKGCGLTGGFSSARAKRSASAASRGYAAVQMLRSARQRWLKLAAECGWSRPGNPRRRPVPLWERSSRGRSRKAQQEQKETERWNGPGRGRCWAAPETRPGRNRKRKQQPAPSMSRPPRRHPHHRGSLQLHRLPQRRRPELFQNLQPPYCFLALHLERPHPTQRQQFPIHYAPRYLRRQQRNRGRPH